MSPTLTFMPTVRSNTGVFQLFDGPRVFFETATDLEATINFQMRLLKRLYREGKGSPLDLDEQSNTVMHAACNFFKSNVYFRVQSDEKYEIVFQFLQSWQQTGIPLNTTNVSGMTPLGMLALMYTVTLEAAPLSLTQLNIKMLNLGAEFPLFSPGTFHYKQPVITSQECVHCPDRVEAIECNEISQATIAKSLPWLVKTLYPNSEYINELNAIGQISLHFSVHWSEGLRLLLDAGADVDAFDEEGLTPVFYAAHFGLLEPLILLGDSDCALHAFPNHHIFSASDLLLVQIIKNEVLSSLRVRCVFEDGFENIVDAVVRLVARRHRDLEAAVTTTLGHNEIDQLQLSSEKVLDKKISLAVSILSKNTKIPISLQGLTPSESTVFHIPWLNVRQANLLWESGFRDVTELDSWANLC